MSSEASDVGARIRRAIEDHGPIPFSEFMELALYSPGGFYDRAPVGERGHFVTSPHVHYVFGTLLAKALRSFWAGLGQPVPFRIVELGAGDGTLARRVLTELEEVPVDYWVIERGEGARQALEELPVRMAASLEVVEPDLVGCVFANELLDNIPFEWVRNTDQGLMQVFVGLDRDRFVPVERMWPVPLVDAVPAIAVGEDAAVSLEAVRLIERLARIVSHGYVLLIDYGGGDAVQVHGYRDHRVIADVFSLPGSADITAGVNLGHLAEHASLLGMQRLGPFSQRSALLSLGIAEWFEDQRKQQAELLDQRAGLEAVRTFGERSRASLLVDPDGLGQLQWLLLATPECAWPEWAVAAADS